MRKNCAQLSNARNGQNNIKCKMIAGQYNTAASGTGYGGENGIGAIGCRMGFTAVGKTCIVLPVKADEILLDAITACGNIDGATLYAPVDSTQNSIMQGILKHWVNTKCFHF